MNFIWFTQILVRHPFIVLLVVAVFSSTCLVIPFTIKVLPNFSDPQMGFETRGTELANRITAWKNLVEATKTSGLFAVNPNIFLERNKQKYGESIIKRNKKNKILPKPKILFYENTDDSNVTEQSTWVELHNLINSKKINRSRTHIIKRDYFCGPPAIGYAHVVLESKISSDLFTLESLQVLCRLEYELIQAKYYKELCIETIEKPKRCCKPWSLANYIAQIHNRTSCLAITEKDVTNMKTLLGTCSPYFNNLQLAPDCFEKGHCKVPVECTRYNSVFNILNFLTSTSFLPPHKLFDLNLKQTMIFLPIASSIATIPYYHSLEKANLEYNGISVVAMEFGIKYALFDKYLVRDAWLISAGGLFIVLCMWMYTKSLFLTIMTIIAIIFSLGVAYFMYTLVFELRFFPFMNLLAIVVALGIGADDAFIFSKAWYIAKKEKNRTIIKIMNDTFHHAFISMLITSLTTAAAFSASYISSITAVCCFSVFATIAVVVNCILMLTWLPATIIVLENWHDKCSLLHNRLAFLLRYWITCKNLLQCQNSLIHKLWINREQILVDCIINFRYYWIILFTGLTFGSCIIVFYYPKLLLPNSADFQLFDSSHPFEKYDMVYKHKFWFERSERITSDNYQNYKLPLRFVWGILPVDNGNHLDPRSLGTLKLDPNFDISKKESQMWLLQFCRQIRKQPFYQPILGALIPNCFIESFINWMQRRCTDPIDHIDRTPCCETEHFPYNSSVFNLCIVSAMNDLYETPSEYFIPGMAGPKFSKDQFPTIKAIVVEYDSNYSYSISYKYMNDFIRKVEIWMTEQLKSAPVGMRGGWFVSEFQFYDLQKILAEGTTTAIIFSMTLALTVLLISTLNVFASLYAILTITSSILVIMAVLVLLGWKLNVLESIAISTAIGLTVDFSLHYVVYYKLCPNKENRETATRYALTCMTGPSTMAAITTGAAGAFMMPSLILPYIQIGIFLITVMSISWLYATFYLGSILAVAGPQKQFGQFRYSNLLCCLRKSNSKITERHNRPTSSSSDTYELDFLSSKHGFVRPINRSLQRSLSNKKTSIMRHFRNDSPSTASAITVIITDDN